MTNYIMGKAEEDIMTVWGDEFEATFILIVTWKNIRPVPYNPHANEVRHTT